MYSIANTITFSIEIQPDTNTSFLHTFLTRARYGDLKLRMEEDLQFYNYKTNVPFLKKKIFFHIN